MNDNDNKDRNSGDTKEIFEKKYGNMENYSRQAVKTLFDDDVSTEPIPEPSTPPYKRAAKNTEDEYEAYLNSTSRYIQEEEEKRKKQREAAIKERDDALNTGWPKANQKNTHTSHVQSPTEADYERMEVSRISRAASKPVRAKGEPGTLNMRNIIALGLVVLLFIFAMLIWWIASMNSRMHSAIEELEELQGRYNMLQAENQDLQAQIYITPGQPAQNLPGSPIFGDDETDENPEIDNAETTTTIPQVTQPPAFRVHTVQAGETLSSISRHFFGNTARIDDIIALNNISNPDNVPIDTVLYIPN